jgi:hypothetical protein
MYLLKPVPFGRVEHARLFDRAPSRQYRSRGFA